jgi:hypothetical protein
MLKPDKKQLQVDLLPAFIDKINHNNMSLPHALLFSLL